MKKTFPIAVMMLSVLMFAPSALQAQIKPAKTASFVIKAANRAAEEAAHKASQYIKNIFIRGSRVGKPPVLSNTNTVKPIDVTRAKQINIEMSSTNFREVLEPFRNPESLSLYFVIPREEAVSEANEPYFKPVYTSQADLGKDIKAIYDCEDPGSSPILEFVTPTGEKGFFFPIAVDGIMYAPAGRAVRKIDPLTEVIAYYPNRTKVQYQLVNISELNKFKPVSQAEQLQRPHFANKLTPTHYVKEPTEKEMETSNQLYQLIFYKDMQDVFDIFDQGFSVNTRTVAGGGTQLHAMINLQAYEMIRPAIEKYHADLAARDFAGRTPIFAALNNPDALREICKAIMEKPELFQELYRTTPTGKTALDIAKYRLENATTFEEKYRYGEDVRILEEADKTITEKMKAADEASSGYIEYDVLD